MQHRIALALLAALGVACAPDRSGPTAPRFDITTGTDSTSGALTDSASALVDSAAAPVDSAAAPVDSTVAPVDSTPAPSDPAVVPTDSTGAMPDSSAVATAVTLLSCPRTVVRTIGGFIGPQGGKLEIGPAELEVPPGALRDTQWVTITVPVGDVLRVDATVGAYATYRFDKPVWLTLNYSKCPPPPVGAQLLAAYIGPNGQVLEKLRGTDDKVVSRFRFSTDHFSGYAIAF